MNADLPVFTPRETVSELDRFIIGQNKAKRAVAIALRNRWRRHKVPEDLRDEIAPKNIIMIGPTGVGKTEIARRLAKLAQAPFLKVEASKFTEVGYVGRDVESMIRDLTQIGVDMVKAEQEARIQAAAQKKAEDKLIDLLLKQHTNSTTPAVAEPKSYFSVEPDGATSSQHLPAIPELRDQLRRQLRAGDLDDKEVTFDQTASPAMPNFEMFAASGMEDMMSGLKDALGNLQSLNGQQTRSRSMTAKEALRVLTEQEAEQMVDMEKVVSEALDRVQHSGIIFLDEIDKIASSGTRGSSGPDVSRGGVQRDLLPVVEGSSVNTKHGIVKTDHILFIAAGAFHESKVSDLIPELQGRFPIRVLLDSLTENDFYRILTEPQNSLVRQYEALLATEDVTLNFTEEALHELAAVAYSANTRLENIGARRLHTVMETLLDDISFRAPEMSGDTEIDADLVKIRLRTVLEDEDLSRYIL